MKYSDDTDDHRKANIDYVNKRWEQLYGLELEFSTEGIKYLLFVNAGAAVAVLAFHGSVPAVRDMVWPKVMLAFFVVGVILIGVLHIARYRVVSLLFKHWQKSVNEYFTEAKGWSEVTSADVAKARKYPWVPYLGYASFACFVIGAAIGMFNFSTLTSGESHVGKEAITPAVSAKTTSTTESTINRRQDAGRGAEEVSDAKHASTAPNTQEIVKSVQVAPVSGAGR
jgi:hypothetical protein